MIWQHKQSSLTPTQPLPMFVAVFSTTIISGQTKKFLYIIYRTLFALSVLNIKTQFQPMGSVTELYHLSVSGASL